MQAVGCFTVWAEFSMRGAVRCGRARGAEKGEAAWGDVVAAGELALQQNESGEQATQHGDAHMPVNAPVNQGTA